MLFTSPQVLGQQTNSLEMGWSRETYPPAESALPLYAQDQSNDSDPGQRWRGCRIGGRPGQAHPGFRQSLQDRQLRQPPSVGSIYHGINCGMFF